MYYIHYSVVCGAQVLWQHAGVRFKIFQAELYQLCVCASTHPTACLWVTVGVVLLTRGALSRNSGVFGALHDVAEKVYDLVLQDLT